MNRMIEAPFMWKSVRYLGLDRCLYLRLRVEVMLYQTERNARRVCYGADGGSRGDLAIARGRLLRGSRGRSADSSPISVAAVSHNSNISAPGWAFASGGLADPG